MQAMLKQELKVESQKLKRLEVMEERRCINRKFKIAPKSVFCTMKGEGSEPVRDVPDPEKLEKFWGGIGEQKPISTRKPHGLRHSSENM